MFQQHAFTENDNENYFTTYEIMRMRTRMRFQKFAFLFHWKHNESIASTRSLSYRFARPHENDENDWKRFQPSTAHV